MGGDVPGLTERLRNEFPNSALGLIGCRSSGEAYPPCEYDYLILSDGGKRFERMLIDGQIVDLLFVDEESILNSDDPLALALIDLNIVSDPGWHLRPLLMQIRSESPSRLRLYARHTIFESLSDLGRFRDSFDADNQLNADLWLKSSAYDLAAAVTASRGMVPRRSHLLTEFRQVAEDAGGLFRVWSEILGLDLATDVAVVRRLDALREFLTNVGSGDPGLAYRLAEARSNYLVKSHAVVDAYCYLGAELMQAVESAYELRCRSTGRSPVYQEIFSNLEDGGGPSMQTVRLIGLSSDEALLREQGAQLQDVVRSVARRLSKEQT